MSEVLSSFKAVRNGSVRREDLLILGYFQSEAVGGYRIRQYHVSVLWVEKRNLVFDNAGDRFRKSTAVFVGRSGDNALGREQPHQNDQHQYDKAQGPQTIQLFSKPTKSRFAESYCGCGFGDAS